MMGTGGFNYHEYFRSLTFGGLIGALVVGIIYLKFSYFHAFAGLKATMFFGGILGASAQRSIQACVTFIAYPLGRVITYYERIFELDALLRWGKISEEQHKALNGKLTEQRFLGTVSNPVPPTISSASDNLQLPPKP